MCTCVRIYVVLLSPCLFMAMQTNNTTNTSIITTTNTTFYCRTNADCSWEELTENSKYIFCLEGKCFCDDTCFDRVDGKCRIRKCYAYSFGEDSCEFSGRNWRITSILAKYTGYLGAVYFYLGRWVIGAVQLSIFTAIIVTLPVIIVIYCVIGFVMLKVGVKLRELYGIVKRVVVSIVCVCCVHCLCVGVCMVWYVVVTVMVTHNLLKDAEGCGMGNEPTNIHVV